MQWLPPGQPHGFLALFATAGLLAAAVLGGCGSGARGPNPSGGLDRVSGPSPYAQCSFGAPGLNYTDAEVEPYVAVNPKAARAGHATLIGVWQQDRWSNGASSGIASAYSNDAGHTWHEGTLPFGACGRHSAGTGRVTDPWVSVGPDGTAYVAAAGIGPAAVLAATSSTGSRTWRYPRVVSNAPGGVDRVSITANPARSGVAYIVWQSTQGTFFTRTTDHGRSWSSPVVIVPGQSGSTGTNGNQILVDRRTGVLYDIFDRFQMPSPPVKICGRTGSVSRCHTYSTGYDVAIVSSTDGGTTWSFPRLIAHDLSLGWVVPSAAGKVRTGANLPEAAINPATGTLYVVWQDSRFTLGAIDDVLLSSSGDGGRHWSGPRRVNVTGKASAILPSVAVNSAGAVGVGYYQIRQAAPGKSALPTDYWFRVSSDGGRSFRPAIHVGGPFDLTAAPLTSAYFIGDYEGLTAVGRSFQPFFVMTNAGNPKNRTDVFTRTVAP